MSGTALSAKPSVNEIAGSINDLFKLMGYYDIAEGPIKNVEEKAIIPLLQLRVNQAIQGKNVEMIRSLEKDILNDATIARFKKFGVPGQLMVDTLTTLKNQLESAQNVSNLVKNTMTRDLMGVFSGAGIYAAGELIARLSEVNRGYAIFLAVSRSIFGPIVDIFPNFWRWNLNQVGVGLITMISIDVIMRSIMEEYKGVGWLRYIKSIPALAMFFLYKNLWKNFMSHPNTTILDWGDLSAFVGGMMLMYVFQWVYPHLKLPLKALLGMIKKK